MAYSTSRQLPELKHQLPMDEMNTFLRKLADQFRLTLRPTDTMAWSPTDGIYLTLIEDIPSPEAPLKIAGRVRDSMKKFLDINDMGMDLRVNIGVLLCDAEYENLSHVMKDVEFAREQLRAGLFTNPTIFDREMLEARR